MSRSIECWCEPRFTCGYCLRNAKPYFYTLHNFKAGYVMRSATAYAFSDAVIAGFDNEGNARLLRPYLYATSVGTTGATGLTGFETIDRVNPASLVKFWTKVDAGRTV